mmetsp:Transcript_23006/g.37853  ORF Transcript_23006/g.37853 Transcript_23006/m.37853 type:complete len:255 (+) Transcript_23006:240-1004(+)
MPRSSTPAKASAIGLADLGSLQAVLRGCKSTPGFWFLSSGDKASANGSATARQFKGRESSSGSISSDTSSGTCRTRVPISSEMLSTAPSQASESSFSKDLMAVTSLCMLKRVVNGSESRLRSFFPSPRRTGRVIRKRLRAAVRFWSLSAEASLFSASRDSTGTAALCDRRAKSSPLASKSSFTVAAWLFEVLSVSPSPLGSGDAVPAVLPAPPSTSMGDCEAPFTELLAAAWRISGPSGLIRTRDFLASKSHSS